MKFFLTALLLICAKICFSQDVSTFVLRGKIEGQDNGVLKLYYLGHEGKSKVDSAILDNGKFVFSGSINEPVMAYIVGNAKSISAGDPNLASIFLEPTEMVLQLRKDDFKSLKLVGSKTHDDLSALNSLKEALNKEMAIIQNAYSRANAELKSAKSSNVAAIEMERLKSEVDNTRLKLLPFQKKNDEIDIHFIEKNPTSFLSMFLLDQKSRNLPVRKSLELFNGLSPSLKSGRQGVNIKKELDVLLSGSPGSMAYAFTTTDINGKPLALTNWRGSKYVLLDFWASWCIPCRAGNPHLLAQYQKYKTRGLEIVGISDDDNAIDAWKNAVEKDGIGVWKHVLRGYKRDDLSGAFGVRSYPTKILIDKKGMIIGRYGSEGEGDEDLDRKLAEIFSAK